jgi:hypothetical protein
VAFHRLPGTQSSTCACQESWPPREKNDGALVAAKLLGAVFMRPVTTAEPVEGSVTTPEARSLPRLTAHATVLAPKLRRI